MTDPIPENPPLIGYARQEAHLAKLFAENHLPHALLITGAKGVGKSLFAFKLATFLLAQKDSVLNIQDSRKLAVRYAFP